MPAARTPRIERFRGSRPQASRSPGPAASRAGLPSPIGSPSKRVTGRIPATLLEMNASSASWRCARREPAPPRRAARRPPPSAGSSCGSCRAGSRSRATAWRARSPPHEEQVRGRRLRQVPSSSGTARRRRRPSAPRPARRRSRRGDVVLSAASGFSGSRRTVLETRWRPRSRWSAGVGGTGQAWMTIVGARVLVRRQQTRDRRTTPRETVIRMLASPSGPARPSAASELARFPRASRASRSSGSGIASPAAERRSRATCSASSVGRPAARPERLEHAVAELEAAVERRQVRAVGRQQPAVEPDVARAGVAGHPAATSAARRSRRAARAPWRRSPPTPPPGRSGR